MHTITNEYGEVRACHLVTTKGHAQTSLALYGVRDSLGDYGIRMPEVFYTDTMSDKGLLEEVFPSLLEDVVPADKYGHLDKLEIPHDVRVYVKDGVSAIENTVQAIMDDLPDDGTGEIVVGFDSEWNVEVTPNGMVKHAGKTAIVQIAYKRQVYILQVRTGHCRCE